MAELAGEGVRLELEAAAELRRQERHERVVRREDVRRHQVEADQRRPAPLEAERVVQWLPLEQHVEHQEHQQDVHLFSGWKFRTKGRQIDPLGALY